MLKINALGEACPLPVIKTRNAIRELKNDETVEVKVDNEIAVQNLKKMADKMGYAYSYEKNSDQEYTATIEVVLKEGAAADTDAEGIECDDCAPAVSAAPAAPAKKNTVVVIRSATMGVGNDELGKVLMKGFIFALTQLDQAPDTILFYNGGATITCEGSDSLEDLRSLEEQGTEILTCGTCMNYYGLSDKLAVGSVTNMYEITSKMAEADLIMQP